MGNKNKADLLDVAVRKANKWAIINCHNGNVNANYLLFKYDSLDEIDKVRQGQIVKMTVPPKSHIKGIKFWISEYFGKIIANGQLTCNLIDDIFI